MKHWRKLQREASVASSYYMKRGDIAQALWWAGVVDAANRRLTNAAT